MDCAHVALTTGALPTVATVPVSSGVAAALPMSGASAQLAKIAAVDIAKKQDPIVLFINCFLQVTDCMSRNATEMRLTCRITLHL
jgi:hypothetical protein